ncbi:hypothetical protein BB559_001253 [Furculomyces boomerangus]|uniref:Farnesyl pyrophosphate synthase n=2 Tax=Harpellales TaxID=61421 RepID=A0A2T9Z2H9_9FUNG|nr:hypothetical protein BB559_002633 [Furculomyces boomerangus]PVU98808.1 hypothetical protein BB559_001253 [Furculomyces boomerangus]PWA01871.1 hypothetical protein BB558_002009 [Smittium angustum]
MSSKANLADFIAHYKQLEDDICQDLSNFEATTEMVSRIKHLLDYNLQGGKLNRGLAVVDSAQIILGDSFSEDIKTKAIILGWCIEWLQAFFLVADDIMDESPMRRGRPSWYRNEGVGMIAINDSFIIESAIYRILKKYFRDTDYYVELLEIFHEVTYQTELGQMVDLTTAPEIVNLDMFSIEKHTFIVKYKTSFYSFYLPVALALLATGKKNSKEAFDIARNILVPMGVYFQVQDDYLDLYGDVNLTGKVGTDIKDNKCSWLVIQALKVCSPEQRMILDKHYGRKSDADEQKVKQVFEQLDIKGIFHKYSDETEQKLVEQIESIDANIVNPKVFISFLQKISKRQK